MENAVELLKKLEALCRDWRELVREDYLKGHTDYADGYVRCYFADNSNHTGVRIGNFYVSFFHPPKLEATIRDFPRLEETISKGRALYHAEKERRALVPKAEKNRLLAETRARLERQLSEITAELDGEVDRAIGDTVVVAEVGR